MSPAFGRSWPTCLKTRNSILRPGRRAGSRCAWVVVIGDEPRLRQIVANLLENAQLHTPAGSAVRIEVGVRDGMAVFAVIDTGPGIDPEQVPHVFERVYRGTPPGSGDAAPRARGSGLGLAIVKTIAEAHGGSAAVSSRPGEGARFEITLPLG